MDEYIKLVSFLWCAPVPMLQQTLNFFFFNFLILGQQLGSQLYELSKKVSEKKTIYHMQEFDIITCSTT